MFEFSQIYSAYMECRKNKRNSKAQLRFELNLIDELCNLEFELKSRAYSPKDTICFLTSSPKLREVFAPSFRDRVVHHLLLRHISKPYMSLINESAYSNIKGRGTHKAMLKAREYMTDSLYYLQLDIRGFFYSIDKDILFDIFKRDILSLDIEYKDETLYLARSIIYFDPTKSYKYLCDKKLLDALPSHKSLFKIPPNKGLAIGNLTSQFFANVYMRKFDEFVQEELGVRKYIRYVDDFVLFDDDKEYLSLCKDKIERYLSKNLSLRLRKEYRLRANSSGLDFLGYIIRASHILVRKRVINNYKFKKAKYLTRYENLKGKMNIEEIKKFLAIQASFLAHIKWANSYNLKNKVGYIDEHSPKIRAITSFIDI